MTRRLPARRRLARPRWAISVGAALAIIGFVAAAQWNSSLGRQQEFTTSAQRVLITEAQQAQLEQEQLRAQIEEAEARVRSFQERDEGSRTELERLNSELAAARLAGGLTEVRGPGVVVEISDSISTVPAGDNPSSYLVLVDDLRDIVNALWASGAEAITVAGSVTGDAPAERLVPTSSIAGGGASILVNFTPLSPPFRIEAIGSEGLHERFLTNPIYLVRVAKRIDAFGLRFASEPRDELTLPAFVGNTRMRWGTPAEGPS